MKNAWYLGIFVFALALVGISLDKTTSANQEIVLKFTESDVTQSETQEVIRFVKLQLEDITVGGVQIDKSDNGTLKITYYSDVAIAQIKKLLSAQNKLVLAGSKSSSEGQLPVPKKKDLTGYQLDVFEIEASKNISGFVGTLVEFKTESIRFYTPDVYTFSQQLLREEAASVKCALQSYTTIALAIDDSSWTVPQVRAGPMMG